MYAIKKKEKEIEREREREMKRERERETSINGVLFFFLFFKRPNVIMEKETLSLGRVNMSNNKIKRRFRSSLQ